MIAIRPATPGDEESLGVYGAALMRQHHAADPRRFISSDHPEAAYGRFLVSQIGETGTRLLVAEQDGRIVGYVFAALEGTSWMELRGPCGVVHDLYVDEAARGQGAGRQLMRAALDWIHAQGRAQTVLLTKTGNEHAQALFKNLGFRATMLEMTHEQDAP
jgi:ribosomal protein S18 acetylase RimI-like enzyme